eukprot:193500_1
MFLSNNTPNVWYVDINAGNAMLPSLFQQPALPITPPLCPRNNVSLNIGNKTNMMNPNQKMLCNSTVLNAKADAFVPNNYGYLQEEKHCCGLKPIEEEKEMKTQKSYQRWQTRPLYPEQQVLRCKYIIFIPNYSTKQAIRNALFVQHFASDSDLFYFLRYQCKMQVIDGLYKLFTCYDQQMVIFNTELHANDGQQSPVFIVGEPNDKGKDNAVKWKMIEFMTAAEIHRKYNIKASALPRGSRVELYKRSQEYLSRFKGDVSRFINAIELNMDTMRSLNKIGQIKSEARGAQPLIVTFDQLAKCMRQSIRRNVLRPIVWFSNSKSNATYRTQMMLPIELEDGNCIGITFDYDEKGHLVPVKFCIDDVDMRRKLTLYKPCEDKEEYALFTNEISEIYITNNSAQQLIFKQNERIKALEKMMLEKENEIEALKAHVTRSV